MMSSELCSNVMSTAGGITFRRFPEAAPPPAAPSPIDATARSPVALEARCVLSGLSVTAAIPLSATAAARLMRNKRVAPSDRDAIMGLTPSRVSRSAWAPEQSRPSLHAASTMCMLHVCQRPGAALVEIPDNISSMSGGPQHQSAHAQWSTAVYRWYACKCMSRLHGSRDRCANK